MHSNSYYRLSDQGLNVDGDIIRKFCDEFGIKKRRSSAYHSQGNSFSERNIHNVKAILCSALLHRNMSRTKWPKLLPELIFALNTSESKAMKYPYKVVFGRYPVLPIDVKFDVRGMNQLSDLVSLKEYSDERLSVLKDMYETVITHSNISKEAMMK